MGQVRFSVFVLFVLLLNSGSYQRLQAQTGKTVPPRSVSFQELRLTEAAASNFANLTLKCILREYPNKLDHVMNTEMEVQSPSTLHPVFYGCFDWHSSVHGHWMLVRILRMFPNLPEALKIRYALNQNLTATHIAVEVKYLEQANRKSFERTYGWAWLVKLAEELSTWNAPDGKRWSEILAPLTTAIINRYLDFLPRQTYPIRTGVHPNTAFGIAFALDYARTAGNTVLEKMLVERSLEYYAKDKNAPIQWEPGGEDFFSPSLMEADLMRRVMKSSEFAGWFSNFIPALRHSASFPLLTPAIVSDRTDPKIVHLDGLNLSRAWCMIGIASSLPQSDPARKKLLDAALKHSVSTLPHITSGNYEGEHWLGSFAVYLLSQVHRLKDR
ncbi:MAG: DUF2891 domain-containing protein [bacterium]